MHRWLQSPLALFSRRLFDGDRSACTALRLFRVVFFLGLAVHFAPFVIHYRRYLGSAVERGQCNVATPIPDLVGSAVVLALGYLGVGLGLMGLRTRWAALAALLAFQTLMGRNCYPVQTLALSEAWIVLLLFTLGGAGSGRPVGGEQRRPHHHVKCGCGWTATVVLYATLIGVFFAGVEKISSGWGKGQNMTNLLGFPPGHAVRAWLPAVTAGHRSAIGLLSEWATVGFEIGAPVLVAVSARTRAVQGVWIAFFLGIAACFEVPPLFVTTFGAAILLAPPLSSPVPAAATNQAATAPG